MALPRFFDPLSFGIDFAFTIIAVIFCFVIYRKTKEIHELTKHEGIKYFRYAFLFFGLSYVFRFFLSLALLGRIAFDVFIPRNMFPLVFILPLSYFSTVGIFYLLYVASREKISGRHIVIIGHVVAILLSLVSIYTRSHIILLFFQSILLIIAAITSIFKGKKRITNVRILFFLVSILWLINLWIMGKGPRRPFSLWIEILSQFVCIVVFSVIYHKITKWVR